MDRKKIGFDDIPYKHRTFPVCMELLRDWDTARSDRLEITERRIRFFVPIRIEEAVRTQCKLEGLI